MYHIKSDVHNVRNNQQLSKDEEKTSVLYQYKNELGSIDAG